MGTNCSNPLCVRPISSNPGTSILVERNRAYVDQGGPITFTREQITKIDKKPERPNAEFRQVQDQDYYFQKYGNNPTPQNYLEQSESQYYDARGSSQNVEDEDEYIPQNNERDNIYHQGSSYLRRPTLSRFGLEYRNQESQKKKSSLTNNEGSRGSRTNISLHEKRGSRLDLGAGEKRSSSKLELAPLEKRRSSRSDMKVESRRNSKHEIQYQKDSFETPTPHDHRKQQLIDFGIKALQLIKEKNQQGYQRFEEIYHNKKAEHGLKLYFLSYTNPHGKKVHSFRFDFYVPCTPDQYGKYIDDFEEQKRLDPEVEEYKLIEPIHQTNQYYFNIYYLSYPTMIVSKGRDFLYLRASEYGHNVWADCCRSVEHKNVPENPRKVRGEMVCCGHFVQKKDDPKTGKVRSRVQYYSEIDVKANVPAFIVKNISKRSLCRHVESIVKRINELYR